LSETTPLTLDREASPSILLVEDESLFAKAVATRLARCGYRCETTGTLADGRDRAAALQPDLILLDLRLPDGDALEFLPQFAAARDKGTAVIVVTAFGDVADAVQAMKLGAVDYLKKPIDLDELQVAVEQALQSARLRHRLDFSRTRDSLATEGVSLIGESGAIGRLREQIANLSGLTTAEASVAPPTVLILGETGSGKDVAARLLHHSSGNAGSPFVHVDCAGLPRDLIEAELFGHEKGAFTSAVRARAGLIEAAEDGTVFLDEIGELPLDLQAKLLNVIERRRVRRVGAVRERSIPARFVAATNRDLPAMIADGRFRGDLYFRLNVITLMLPPLRAREGDAELLCDHYAALTARRYGLPEPRFDDSARAAIRAYDWPGNVRELKHLVERAVLLCRGRPISRQDLALADRGVPPAPEGADWRSMTLAAAERVLIDHALTECAGNVSEAARRLGVTRMALRYRIEKHGLAPRVRTQGGQEHMA
jgi:two-component system, NtrC family, response regulator AtoC